MDFDITLGLHDDLFDYIDKIEHFAMVSYDTKIRIIWLYLSEDIVTRGIITGTHSHTGEPFIDTIMEWVIFNLNHEYIHILCDIIGENSHFDPISGLGPEGL